MKNDLVVKSNTLIDASFKLSLVEYRLLNIIFAEISNNQDGSSGYWEGTEFKVTAKTYMSLYSVDKSTAYEALKEASKRLFHRYFTYEGTVFKKPDYVETIESRWVSKIRYSKQAGYVSLVLTNDVLSMVGVLQECFTRYHLQHTAGLTSIYAKRLYEIMLRWHNAGSKTPMIEIEDLRNKLGVDTNQYKQMNNFKRLVLEQAIKQINEHTNMTAKYEQHKEGRKIVGFTFKFKINSEKLVNQNKRDPNTIDWVNGSTDNELKPLTPKASDYFGNIMTDDTAFGMTYGNTGESRKDFVSRIKREIQTKEGVLKYANELKKFGYVSPKTKGAR